MDPDPPRRGRRNTLSKPPFPEVASGSALAPDQPPAADQIRALLRSPNPEEQLRAVRIIGALADRTLKLTLLKEVFLLAKEEGCLYAAIDHLREAGGPEATDILLEVIRNPRLSWMKGLAARALGVTGGPQAVEPLLELYHSTSQEVQVAAARSLRKLSYPGPAAEMLLKLARQMDDPDGAVRRDAAEYLSDLDFPEALPLMTRALGDSNGDVRWQAVLALRNLGTPEVIPLLERAARDPYPPVEKDAKEGLEELRGRAKGH